MGEAAPVHQSGMRHLDLALIFFFEMYGCFHFLESWSGRVLIDFILHVI